MINLQGQCFNVTPKIGTIVRNITKRHSWRALSDACGYLGTYMAPGHQQSPPRPDCDYATTQNNYSQSILHYTRFAMKKTCLQPYIKTMQIRKRSLQWRHNEPDGTPNYRRLDCLLNSLSRRRSTKTSKLRVTGLCEGNSPVTGEFPAQRASNAENVSIWWRHHGSAPVWEAAWPRFRHNAALLWVRSKNTVKPLKCW